jgi:tetratricopeptide (TPR) repeat protein
MNRPTEHHPLYGEIPLVEHRTRGSNGREYVWLQYDPAYEPKLPKGAIRGDVSRQVYCVAHHVPKYFYVDEDRTCIQCKEPFVFRAEEQKYWYETLKFNFGSIAVRCRSCRRKKRTEASLRDQIGSVLRQLEQHPDDSRALLELARTTVMYRERTGEGNLQRAIAACRKAVNEAPESPEPLYWEGRCHEISGRTAKATECFVRFLANARNRHGLRELVANAERKVSPKSR